MENVLRFEHPEYLYWLLIIPVLVIIYILFRLGQKRRFERFAHIGMREQLVPSYSSRRSTLKFILFLLIIACSILALANLQSGSKMEEVKREGIDLYIAVDVSNSMNAEDIVPSRLERSKQAINKLISEMRGDRIGVIVFADKAFVQLPITTDYSAAKMFLSTINTKLVASQGTAIAEAINLALKSFPDEAHSRAIVIISVIKTEGVSDTIIGCINITVGSIDDRQVAVAGAPAVARIIVVRIFNHPELANLQRLCIFGDELFLQIDVIPRIRQPEGILLVR